MTVRVMFAWYDFWIGFYWDRNKKVLYICPLPMMAIRISFPWIKTCCKHCRYWDSSPRWMEDDPYNHLEKGMGECGKRIRRGATPVGIKQQRRADRVTFDQRWGIVTTTESCICDRYEEYRTGHTRGSHLTPQERRDGADGK